MKLKLLLAALGSSMTVFAADPIIDYSDRDRVCTDHQIEIRHYAGWASCRYNEYINGSWHSGWINQYVHDSTSQWTTLSEYNHQLGRSVSCSAAVPYSHSTYTTQQTCHYVPREPFVNSAFYEYGACRYYTRQGFVSWAAPQGATSYDFQKYEAGAWRNITSTSATAAAFDVTYGGKNYNLRVRAKNSSETGSYHYFSAYVPKCFNGGGVEPR